MKIRQEQFFENMQKAQSQYLDELKSLRTRQDEMVNQQNNFYRQIKREQEKTIKEIEERGGSRLGNGQEMPHQERDIVVGLINKQIPTLLRFHHTRFLISFIAMWQTRRILNLELSNQIYNKENLPKLLTKLPKILLILRIKVV
ncbi:hypothetical protein PIB30_071474 [Stylosanthes scabra]|uniref:Uncharacterized protein n=1 Tax=Stylosanthes scabra TaxID=79078 RepID=A0ABU6VQL8_9FABA|nr:hypothetical protein [Stylosanthes scabra]